MINLKYPLMMVHGMGFRDYRHINYWGRIPQVMQKNGIEVFYGYQDSNGSIEGNARQVAGALDDILKKTGAPKVNIIAHSKGGLEARYMISSMGYADKVASLTTISTPHHGSVTVDKLTRHTMPAVKLGCKAVDVWYKLTGDKKPDTLSAVESFTTKAAEEFNRNNPDAADVYYQSYGFVMKKSTSDILMCPTWLVVNYFEGENDGLLPPDSVKWTNFKGIYSGTDGRGISHCDEVDLRRSRLSSKNDGDVSDITEFYLDIVKELSAMGF